MKVSDLVYRIGGYVLISKETEDGFLILIRCNAIHIPDEYKDMKVKLLMPKDDLTIEIII